jgi:hypothetical protein
MGTMPRQFRWRAHHRCARNGTHRSTIGLEAPGLNRVTLVNSSSRQAASRRRGFSAPPRLRVNRSLAASRYFEEAQLLLQEVPVPFEEVPAPLARGRGPLRRDPQSACKRSRCSSKSWRFPLREEQSLFEELFDYFEGGAESLARGSAPPRKSPEPLQRGPFLRELDECA